MLPNKIGIAIPSCGYNHLATCILSIIERTHSDIEINICVCLNPKDREEANETILQCEKILSVTDRSNVNLKIKRHNQPIGFGRACNDAIKTLKFIPDLDFLIVLNDDVTVTHAWATGLWFASKTRTINSLNRIHSGEPAVPLEECFKENFKGIGLVGAISRGATGQQVSGDANGIAQLGLVEYARRFKIENAGRYVYSEYLSGFCFGITIDCLNDLWIDKVGLFDERFEVGGFEDNDLCIRADRKGWGLVVAGDTYVGHAMHKTLDRVAPSAMRGTSNFLTFLKKYEKETQRYQSVVGVIRVSFKCVNDLAQYFSCIRRSSLFVDGYAILLTNDPTEMVDSYDKNLIDSLPEVCNRYLKDMVKLKGELGEEEYKIKTGELIKGFTCACLDPRRNHPIEVVTERWLGDFNERDERNRTHEMADKMEADWLFSIDADEVIEDRISPKLFRKWINNPNPQKLGAYVGWINHWETMNLVRIDTPFTVNGVLRMSGCRLFKRSQKRIISGNDVGFHCGNAPYISHYSMMDLGFRFRHLSHVRGIDRLAKTQFYMNVDRDKRRDLIGGDDYSHIIKSEKVEVSIYNPANGIATFCLMYEEEDETHFGINLDRYFGISDRLIVVWTGEWKEEDKEWLDPTVERRQRSAWYTSGPKFEVAEYSRLYKVEWVHYPLEKTGSLADCRNAALDYIQDTNDGTIAWAYFFDPDEQPHHRSPNVTSYMRGMAELNDTLGFMVNFENITQASKDGSVPHAKSESIRMFRLHPSRVIRFSGKVHETLDEAFKKLKENGIHPNIQLMPLRFFNTGLLKSPEKMREKLEKYQGMLIEELKEYPLKSASWLALGLQLLNDDDEERAQICMERSVLTAGTAYMPFKELSIMHMRTALGLMIESRRRCTDSFPFSELADQIIEFLEKVAPPLPKVDTGSQDVSRNITLPDFPYDKISLDEENNLVVEVEKEHASKNEVEAK